MKGRTRLQVMAILSVVCLLVTGCGKKSVSEISSDSVSANKGLKDSTSEIVSDTASTEMSEVGDSNISTGNSSGIANGNQNGNTATGSGNNAASKTPLVLTKVNMLKADDALKAVPKELKNSTIKYCVWYDIAKNGSDGEQAALDKFTAATGVKVDVIVRNFESYKEDIIRMVAAGKSPDCIRLTDNSIYKVKDSLSPIEETALFDFSGNEWDAGVNKAFSFNGKKYAVNVSNSVFYSGICVYYNTKVFKKYGIEDPYSLSQQGKWNWDKFSEICQTYKAKVPNSIAGATFCPMNIIPLTKGTDLIRYDEGKSAYINACEDPSFQEGWRYTRKMVTEGLLTENVNQLEDFLGGTVGMFVSSTNSCLKGNKTLVKLSSKGVLGIAPLPKDSDSDYKPAEINAFGICKGANNPKAIPYFLRYICDVDVYGGDSYFYNKSAKDIYFSSVKTDKRSFSYGDLITADLGEENTVLTFNLYHDIDTANIGTFLSSKKNVIQTAVDRANESIRNLK